jgi:hypothetical protein
MKTIAVLFLTANLLFAAGCVVVAKKPVAVREPRGWHKNPNNPHHPATTNPGHTKQHGKGNPGHR